MNRARVASAAATVLMFALGLLWAKGIISLPILIGVGIILLIVTAWLRAQA